MKGVHRRESGRRAQERGPLPQEHAEAFAGQGPGASEPGSRFRESGKSTRRGQATLQRAPLRMKAVGFGLLPVQVPLKPGAGLTLAPGATAPL